ncbi:MAG TPA: phosphoribosylformylglycinamidine synthase subunit PurQ, partial [Lacipirellulaceae bacterium]
TNCDEETAHAFSLAGGSPERWHVNRVLEKPQHVGEFQILCLPGGFSYGDDIAAGRILGNQIRHHLADVLQQFRDAGKLILGICNGFQVLLKTELLLPFDQAGPAATLASNDSGHFEDRWVRLVTSGSKCVFLSEIEELELPVAHGEGKFVTRDTATLTKLREAGQLVLRYESREADSARRGSQGVAYPDNPNGAVDNVAGICDASGRVFGLMPHPERFVDPTQHPTWTRGPAREVGEGLAVFRNAVRYFL